MTESRLFWGGAGEATPPSGWPSEVQVLWRGLKIFFRELGELGDMLGRVALDGYRLAQEVLGFAGRHGGPPVALATVVGGTSPVTGGWGLGPLQGSTLGAWLPVVAVPLAIAILRAGLRGAGRASGRAAAPPPQREGAQLEIDFAPVSELPDQAPEVRETESGAAGAAARAGGPAGDPLPV